MSPHKLVRRALFFCLFGVASLGADVITGTWTGTYSLTSETCPGTLAGPATLYARQSGASFTAVLDIDAKLFEKCVVKSQRMALPMSGTMAGSGLSGTFLAPFSDGPSIPFTGTLGGDALRLKVTPAGQQFEFTMTQSGSAPPAASLAGTYAGTYSITVPLTQDCTNLQSYSYAGALGAVFFQGESLLSGILEIRNRRGFDRGAGGECTIVDKPDERLVVMGSVAEGTIDGAFVTDEEVVPLTATVEGETIRGTAVAEDLATMTFALTRTSEKGSPMVLEFAADPSTVRSGQSTTLRWTVFNAASVSIDPGVGTKPASGSVVVTPAGRTTYTLTAAAENGMAVTARATVSVTTAEPPVIVAFSAVPAEIFAGGCSVLSWNTANATSVTIDNGVGSKPASGSTTVCPGSTTTYTLTATGDGGSVTRSVMVTVTRGWGRRRAAGHRG